MQRALASWVRCVVLLLCLALDGTAPQTLAEDGYRLWLRYERVDDPALLDAYRTWATQIVVPRGSATLEIIRNELHAGLSGLLRKSVPMADSVTQAGALVVGTPKSVSWIATPEWAESLEALGDEGYRIRSTTINGRTATVIGSKTDIGALYGAFHFLRLIQTRQPLGNLDISERPAVQRRLLNHWDDLDGTCVRGYAGRSLWLWDELPGKMSPRYRDYARANASIGLNGTVLNNVNTDATILTREYLVKVAALADAFRPYGIRVYLSPRFSAPIEIGGLKTADPKDRRVVEWWRSKTEEIYRLIPDFGGYLVKANSESQPGPQDYGRSHADGANMLAEAVAPHGGAVMWRAFVYNNAIDPDLVKCAYQEFVPLDGKFRDNVLVQVKTGPLDFLPREPFHPLYGAMPKTPLMAELQITQEYLGHSTYLIYLGTLWKEFLDSDTFSQGPGSQVARIIDGSLSDYRMTGMAGVSNVGDDRNWCGHDFAQANWYAFGRLAWNHRLGAEETADEWIRMTWTHDPEAIAAIRRMMMGSRETAVDYMTPFGLGIMVRRGDHYEPDPQGRQKSKYHGADEVGLGCNRAATGNNAVAQYFPPLSEQWNDIRTTRDGLLCWFHHVPWNREMPSGRTFWDELCHRYCRGVEGVQQMQASWDLLGRRGVIDRERFQNVAERLRQQAEHAAVWRDTFVKYFQQFSGQPVPREDAARFGRRTVIPVVLGAQAAPLERAAARELCGHLGRLYPDTWFEIQPSLTAPGEAILVGSVESDPGLRKYVDSQDLDQAEGFEVTTVRAGNRTLGVIVGADPRGAVYGVYSLLERLGYGFYLSFDAAPAPRAEPFTFDGWQVRDAPLVRDRLGVSWHSYLSGCSTWNLDDWRKWILQLQKMRFNGVMVHAYGNNPMFTFPFAGRTKPVGYLATTASGRDWDTLHVNDVRRLWGGRVFDEPVFGAKAAQVPDAERVAAAVKLNSGVFDYAQQRGMDVYFALDIDTASSNPQDLISRLPADARFEIPDRGTDGQVIPGRTIWLANPETPEGFGYYKAQAESLLKTYPQVDCLALWFRQSLTPWTGLGIEEMPPAWQEEYRAELMKTPEAARYRRLHTMFALSKVVKAFDRALGEIGRRDVKLALGTWSFSFLPGADRFLPPHVKLIGLDTYVRRDDSQLRDEPSRLAIRQVAAHRRVLCIEWAHHDIDQYLGRCYAPPAELASKLADAGASGFGVIHWMTRPLDLYFEGVAKQVWQATKDQPLSTTCDEMAGRTFGAAARDTMSRYLRKWVTEAPLFGRDSDRFVFKPLEDVDGIVSGCRERIKLLDGVPTNTLRPDELERWTWFRRWETFLSRFARDEHTYQRAEALRATGDLAGARDVIRECHPERTVEDFARAAATGGITRGEQGILVSLNLRWWSYFVRLRQALGIEAVRYRFAPTVHEPLAQRAGKLTYYMDSDRQLWQCPGEEEVGGQVFQLPADAPVARPDGMPISYEEICRSGVEPDQTLSVTIQPIIDTYPDDRVAPASLPAGRYRLRFLLLDPASGATGQRVMELAVRWIGAGQDRDERLLLTDRIDIYRETGCAGRVLAKDYDLLLTEPGLVRIALTALAGKPVVSGIILEAAESSSW